MNTTTSAPGTQAGTTTTVTVALTAGVQLSAESLQRVLSSKSSGLAAGWDVTLTNAAIPDSPTAIALCPADSVSTLRRRWPECAVIAVVAAHDDGTGVIAALEAGAACCIREDSAALAAAFILATARRRGLLGKDLYR